MLDQLTILAPGLLGASVAKAAHARGLARRIVIWSRRLETRLQIAEQPWCHAVADSPAEAVRDASLVVIAPPVDRIVELMAQIAPALPDGCLLTDVGSVKGDIARQGHASTPLGRHFIPAHPMAGSDKAGWQHATPGLFEKRVCFITPLEESSREAVARVSDFWRQLGMEIVYTSADVHDEIVAHISHLPQVLASTLASFLSSRDLTWRNYAGGGLRDTTRLAGSDPVMWRAIMEHNRDEILRALAQYQEELQGFQTALANRDYAEISARFERAKNYRSRLRVHN